MRFILLGCLVVAIVIAIVGGCFYYFARGILHAEDSSAPVAAGQILPSSHSLEPLANITHT